MKTLFTFLFLLQFKHLIVDFMMQTTKQVNGKCIYGNWYGITHSLQHAAATAYVVLWVVVLYNININPVLYIALPFFDFVTHYHIDWIKMNFGCRDMMKDKFWYHLGIDQFAHQLVYLIITYNMFSGV